MNPEENQPNSEQSALNITPTVELVPELPETLPELEASTAPVGRADMDVSNLPSGIHPANQNPSKIHLAAKDKTAELTLVLPTGYYADHVQEMQDHIDAAMSKPELEDSRSFQQQARQARRAMNNSKANPGVTALCSDRGQELRDGLTLGDSQARPGFVRRAAKGTSVDAQLTRLGQISGTTRPAVVPLGNSLLFPVLPELTAEAMMRFYYTVTEYRATYGRQAYGMLYTNDNVLVYKALADSILRPMLAFSNLRIIPPTEIKETDDPLIGDPLHYIRVHDVDALLTMLAATYWPQGFDYSRSCVHCGAVHHRRISIPNLLQYDSQRLASASGTFLAQIATAAKPWSEVLAAQEQNSFNEGGALNFVFDHGQGAIRIEFHVPSLAWQLQVGESLIQWIENLVPTSDSLTTQALSERRSNAANMLRLRKIAHYIKSVTTYEPMEDTTTPLKTGVVQTLANFEAGKAIKMTDLRVLNEALARLSSDKTLVDAVYAYLEKMISQTTCNVVAVDSFMCGACGKANMSDQMGSKWPTWLPVNAMSCFFEFIEIEMRRRSMQT